MSKKRPHSFDLLARENGSNIIDFEAKSDVRIHLFTPKGMLTIDYKKWEESNDIQEVEE